MRGRPRTAKHTPFRKASVYLLMTMGVVALIWRLCLLHIDESAFLRDAGISRSVRTDIDHAQRGIIYDRNGEPLAVSSPVKSVWVNGKDIALSPKQEVKLAKILNISSRKLSRKIKLAKNKHFIYLKRHVAPSIGKRVEQLGYPGIHIHTEYRRYYPQGEVSAHILGSTNLDQEGIQGLELVHNELLTGEPGESTLLKDRTGRRVELVAFQKAAEPGNDLQLSIDSRLQYRAFKELMKTVHKYQAKSGSIVAIDVQSGEILSMVNYPSFNPNKRYKQVNEFFRNRAVTDQFEPGSTIKPFSMVNLLSSGDFEPRMIIDTHPGSMDIRGNIIKDVRNFGAIDLNTVIKKSSNVGISKLSLMLPSSTLFDTFARFGFGGKTSSQFPGEQSGSLNQRYNLSSIEHATLSFGYGLTVTPLQLASAYATLASNCEFRPVTFIKRINRTPTFKACEQTVAQDVNKMLQLAVGVGGTGTRAQIPGYPVAGKTGTVRKVSNGVYLDNKHLSLFAGFAPAQHPRVAMVVMIDEPSGKYYGGEVAAPLFAKVMYNALQRLSVPKQKQYKAIWAQK